MMSSSRRFFRRRGDGSSTSSSSSSDDEVLSALRDLDDTTEEESSLQIIRRITTLDSLTTSNTMSSDAVSQVQGETTLPSSQNNPPTPHQYLIHALLKESTRDQAIRDLELRDGLKYDAEDPAVTALAKEKYDFFVSRINPIIDLRRIKANDPEHQRTLNDTTTALENLKTQAPGSSRSQIQQADSQTALLRRSIRRASISNQAAQAANLRVVEFVSQLPMTLQPLVDIPTLENSRYVREFLELRLLGKGGYGKVFHVRNRLDDMEYAIKKIIIPKRHLEDRQLGVLLREIRALAKLDHPNIVRYHAGWLELAVATSAPSRLLLEGPTESETSNNSENKSASTKPRILPASEVYSEGGDEDNAGWEFGSVQENTEVGCSQAESSYASGSSSSTGAEDRLVLHIQMSLHPGTLSHYIKTPGDESELEVLPAFHCFHVGPALRIFHAILDAVYHLHQQGVAHHDLKPGNIFLSFHEEFKAGYIDIMCAECPQSAKSPKARFLNVRIGDFGLVTEIVTCGDVLAMAKQEGTALYRPLEQGKYTEEIDIYALGVILFELLRKFETGMDRFLLLSAIQKENFDHVEKDFLRDADPVAAKLLTCIRRMTEGDEKIRPNCSEIKTMLADMRL